MLCGLLLAESGMEESAAKVGTIENRKGAVRFIFAFLAGSGVVCQFRPFKNAGT